jgi:hypothetical protein
MPGNPENPGNTGNTGNTDISFPSVAASPPSNPFFVPPLPPCENSGMGLENVGHVLDVLRRDEALSARSGTCACDTCDKAALSRRLSWSPSYPAPLPREDEALSALSRTSADDGEEDSCQKAPSSRHSSSPSYLRPHDCELASMPVATTVASVTSDALLGLFCVCVIVKKTYF